MHKRKGRFYTAHMPANRPLHYWWCKGMGRFHVTEHNAWEARTAFLDKLKWYTWSGWISTIHKIKIPDAAKYTPRNDMLVTLRERIRSL